MRRHSPTVRLAGLALCALLAACAPVSANPVHDEPTRGVVEVSVDTRIDPVEPAPVPQLPVTVQSEDGVAVTVTDVSRIIAVDLYGTLAETVFSLGLGDNVVGRDTSTSFEEAAHLPLVTVGGHALSAEAVLDLDPTVVLTDTTIGPPEVQQQLRDAGIPVIFFEPTRTLDGVAPQIERVAAALGVPDAGAELARRTQADIDAALAQAPTDADERVAFLYLRGSAVSLMGGPGSGADELIEALGLHDAGTEIGLDRAFVPITSEALVTAAPDVLLLFEGGLASVNGLDGLLHVPGIAQTSAGTERRVLSVADADLLGFGPRTGATLRALHDALRQVLVPTAGEPEA